MIAKKYVLTLLCLASLSIITFESKAEDEPILSIEDEPILSINNPYIRGGLATFVVGSLWSAYRWAWKGRPTWSALLPDPVRVVFDGFLKAISWRAPFEPAPVYKEQEEELTRNIKRLKVKRSKLSDPRILVKRLLIREIRSVLDQIADLEQAHLQLQQQKQQQHQPLQQVQQLQQSLLQFRQELGARLQRDIMTIKRALSTLLKNALAQNAPLIDLQQNLLNDLQQNVDTYPSTVLQDLNNYLNQQFQQLQQLQHLPHLLIPGQMHALNTIFNRINQNQYPAESLELLRLISLQKLITAIGNAIDAIKD